MYLSQSLPQRYTSSSLSSSSHMSSHQTGSRNSSKTNVTVSGTAQWKTKSEYQNPVVGDVPGSVRNLLLATKELQEILRKWSIGQATETQVSDVYVRIGTQFNATIHAFARHHIDLSDIHTVPTELRTVLEHCLAEDPSPATLEQFMPEVRQALYKMLKGLQSRQDAWRAAQGQASGSISPRASGSR